MAHAARLKKYTALLVTLALAIPLMAGCSREKPVDNSQPLFYRSLVPAGAVVDPATAASMISGYRRNNGLGAVEADPALTAIARSHAQAMARANKVSHDLGSGNLNRRASSAGYRYERINENVAAGYHTLAEAFSGWRESPDHRRNLLMPDAEKMGIAVAQLPGSKYKVFWVLVMAKPEKAPAPAPASRPVAGLLPIPLAGM